MFFFVLAGLGDVQALSQLNFGLFSEPFFYFRHWRWLMFVNKAISLDKMTQVLHGQRLEIFYRDLFIFQFAVFAALVLSLLINLSYF